MSCGCLSSQKSLSTGWMTSLTEWRNPSHHDFNYQSETYTTIDSLSLISKIVGKITIAEVGYALIIVAATIEIIFLKILTFYNYFFNSTDYSITIKKLKETAFTWKKSVSNLISNFNPSPIITNENIRSSFLRFKHQEYRLVEIATCPTWDPPVADNENEPPDPIASKLIINMLGCFDLFANKDSNILDTLKRGDPDLKKFIIAKSIYHFSYGIFSDRIVQNWFSPDTCAAILRLRNQARPQEVDDAKNFFYKNRDYKNAIKSPNNTPTLQHLLQLAEREDGVLNDDEHWKNASDMLNFLDSKATIENLNPYRYKTLIDY